MIEWFKRLFHQHQWEIIAKGNLTSGDNVKPYGKWYDCRCSICGKIKGFET